MLAKNGLSFFLYLTSAALILSANSAAHAQTSQTPYQPNWPNDCVKYAAHPAEPMISTRFDHTQTEQQLRNYICSGDYMAGVARAIDLARARIFARANVEAEKKEGAAKLAIVFDVDETSLSNQPQIFEGDIYGGDGNVACERLNGTPDSYDRGCSHVTWQKWGRDRAIEPTLELYREARDRGIAVFFVTGRNQQDYDARHDDTSIWTVTRNNLVNAGYADDFCLFTKNENRKHEESKCGGVVVDTSQDTEPGETAHFKHDVRDAIRKGHYVIIANIGDQVSDLVWLPDENEPSDENFLLPDPFYPG